jgi:hypothetical protein
MGFKGRIGGKTAAAIGVVAGLTLALVAGVVVADEPTDDLENALQLQAPEGSCITGVDISYLEGQTYEVAAATPEGVVAEISGLSTAEGSLKVRTILSDVKVVDIYKGGAKTGAVRVENVGTLTEPLWVPVEIGSITKCVIEGDAPSAKELLS